MADKENGGKVAAVAAAPSPRVLAEANTDEPSVLRRRKDEAVLTGVGTFTPMRKQQRFERPTPASRTPARRFAARYSTPAARRMSAPLQKVFMFIFLFLFCSWVVENSVCCR